MGNLPSQYFRVGTGAIILNQHGHLFAIERKAIPGAWQLPQGGIDEQEEPLQGVYRELFEETGITDKDVEFVAQYPEPLVYELPAELRKPKTGRGQVQYWFLFASRAMRALSILRLVKRQVPGNECRRIRYLRPLRRFGNVFTSACLVISKIDADEHTDYPNGLQTSTSTP